MLGGIAGGIGRRVGIDTTVVRIALVMVGLVSSGFGFAAYLFVWLVLPRDGEPETIARRAMSDLAGMALAAALVPALAVALLVGSALHAGWLGSLAWAAFLSVTGLVLVFRNAGDDERELIRRAVQPFARLGAAGNRTWLAFFRRVAIGLALMIGGVAGLVLGHGRTLLRPFGGLVLVVAGLVLIFGPWWLSVARDLVAERSARARAEERADMAARLHDSVLQTLALIQRKADQPQQVVQLARAQERELRAWLFEDRHPGDPGEGDTSFAAAVGRIQREVEASHGVPIETVIVGDCPLSGPAAERLAALVAAGREAAVNAAKWSGASVISLFAEVEDDTVSLFVRDRGKGFDPTDVAPDRRGLAESIRARMARHGGAAEIRSAPGAGTEIRLSISRGAAWSGDSGPGRSAGRGAARAR